MVSTIRYSLLVLTMSLFTTGPLAAQVTLPTGVIDVPSTEFPSIAPLQTIGSNTTLNLREGGVAGGTLIVGNPDSASTNAMLNVEGGVVEGVVRVFEGGVFNLEDGIVELLVMAREGSVINISGGEVGTENQVVLSALVVHSGTTANITGGVFNQHVTFFAGSVARVSGGLLNRGLKTSENSDVELVGGDFKLNGLPFSAPLITLDEDDIFTGTLSDGSPFVTSGQTTNAKLTVVEVPAPDRALMIVDGSTLNPPAGIRAGQTLSLRDGGTLGSSFTAIDAVLMIDGGVAGADSSGPVIVNTAFNMSGGLVGENFTAKMGSNVNVSGGRIERNVLLETGSTLLISDGEINGGLTARPGTIVNVVGGSIGGLITAEESSVVDIAGGTISALFIRGNGSQVHMTQGMIGGSARISDGSSFRMSAGSIGQSFTASDSRVDITGGSIGNFTAFPDANVTIEGGQFGSDFSAWTSSHVDISGGTFGADFEAWELSTVNISGGEFGDGFTIGTGPPPLLVAPGTSLPEPVTAPESAVNITGGIFGEDFDVVRNGKLNIYGSHFELDGVPIDLATGVPTIITERDMQLTGRFADGSLFEFDLFSINEVGQDYFDPRATLTLIQVPEPTSGLALAFAVVLAGLGLGCRPGDC